MSRQTALIPLILTNSLGLGLLKIVNRLNKGAIKHWLL
jgi:hypothetical protein